MRNATSILSSLLVLALTSCADDEHPADDTTESSGSDSTGTSAPTTTLDPETSSGPGSESSTTTTDAESSSSTAADTSTGDTGEPTVEIVTELDGRAFEFPEGLVVDGDDAVVGFAFSGAIERVGLDDGMRTPLASTPPPPPNTSFVTGITLDDAGRVYAAVVSFTADLQAGIYRAEAEGGDATLWATDPALVFPNGFAWDDEARLYVSDSSGPIVRVDADGTVSSWLDDPQLAGDPTACGQDAAFTIGPNGIAWTPDALWVASSDLGILASVAIEADGTAGALELVAGPDCELAGIDGITLDDDGSIVAAINRADRIVRITPAGEVTTLVEGEPLSFPASVAFGGSGDDRALYITNFALDEFFAGVETHPSIARARW